MPITRLDKYIADSGIAPRSQIKKAIKEGKVTVDGKITKDNGLKIDTESNNIIYCGKSISYDRLVYIMLNKPSGVISATEDKHDKTVTDLLDKDLRGRRLFPVGRLDKDTTGLLILTNDGDFAHRTLSPSKHIEKTYIAELDKKTPPDIGERFAQGITIGDYKCKPASVAVSEDSQGTVRAVVKISEGKFHQVKRMFEAVGCKVTALERVQFGEIKLDSDLSPGSYRSLNQIEMEYVKKILN